MVLPPLSPINPVCTAADTPVTQTSELFTTTLGELAVDGVLSTTVFPDEVDTVLLLLDTVLETVDDVTVSTAWAENRPPVTTRKNPAAMATRAVPVRPTIRSRLFPSGQNRPRLLQFPPR